MRINLNSPRLHMTSSQLLKANLEDAEDDLSRARAEIKRLKEYNRELVACLRRYRDETPIGHSPHMICHVADKLIAGTE